MNDLFSARDLALQEGFAGFAVALLSILCWVLKRLIRVIETNARAITELTRLLIDARESWMESHHLLLQLRESVRRTERREGPTDA